MSSHTAALVNIHAKQSIKTKRNETNETKLFYNTHPLHFVLLLLKRHLSSPHLTGHKKTELANKQLK